MVERIFYKIKRYFANCCSSIKTRRQRQKNQMCAKWNSRDFSIKKIASAKNLASVKKIKKYRMGGAARKYFSIVVALAMIVGGVAAIIRPYNNKTAADTSYQGVSISSISPNSGPISGGTKITINGQGFLENAESTDISVGQNYACGISNGDVYCWGDNTYGQLGDGTTTTRPKPTKIDMSQIADADNVKFKQVAAGYYHTCAVTTGGYAICWGKNNVGQTGCAGINPVVTGDSSITCSMSSDTTIVHHMHNRIGNQVGNEGERMNYITDTPTWTNCSSTRMCDLTIRSIDHISQVAVGKDYTCYLRNKQAYCFGANTDGQLGIGSVSDREWNSQRVSGQDNNNIKYITAGERKTCFVRDNSGTRELYCWGYNGGSSIRTKPVKVVDSIGDGTYEIMHQLHDATPAIKSSAVYYLDYTTGRQADKIRVALDGTDVLNSTSSTFLYSDQEFQYLNSTEELAAGDRHICARATDGTTTCWGDNDAGQTGKRPAMGSIDADYALATPTISQKFSKIDAGGNSTCGIENGTGHVYCWGQNDRGQLGSGYNNSGGVAIPQQVSLSPSPTVNGANIGGKDCANFTIVSDTQVTCTTPAGDAAGAVDVELYTPGNGRVTASKTDGFTYAIERPVVTDATPNWVDWEDIFNSSYGPNYFPLEISGENFDNVSEVSPTLCTGTVAREHGEIGGEKFQIAGSNVIICNMINNASSGTLAGRHKITVTNPAGTSQENVYVVVSRDSSLIDESFTLSRSSAMVGESAGQLTIETEGFGPDLTNPSVSVKIGGKTCSNPQIMENDSDGGSYNLTCTLPEFTIADIGTKDVVITGIYTRDGNTITLAKKFEVVAPTLTIEEPIDEVNLNLQPGKFSSAPFTVKVATNNPAGYNLSMRFANSNLTMAGNAKKIPSLSGYTSSQATSSVINGKIGQEAFWAYRVGTAENTAETNTATTNYSWSTIPTTDKIIKKGAQTFAIGATSKFEQTDIYFGASATMENPAGTYRATVTFTVTAI